ncbi:MAG TPA: hypothetical protein VK752_32350 [Bryobacteraceae bacterium]|jgi:hypothetical protein|nr:hypothetical protein [Bryobacteraceae bacterium]
MLHFYRRYYLLSLLPVLLASCGRVSTASAEAKPAGASDPVTRSRAADDTARFLAGMPGHPGSPFLNLENDDVWKQHRDLVDAAWHKADGELLQGLREFQARELKSAPMTAGPVFYPFSGPDALMATEYFPQSPVYVFAALEPAGTLPSEDSIGQKDLPEYLAAMRTTMASELGRSFFITRQMDQQFRGQVTDGLLLPILQLLVRTDHTVLGFRYVRLDENGKIIDRTLDYHASTRYGNKGVEVEFRTDADQSLHQLYYFSVNLSDERLRENTPFQTFLQSLKGATTMFKSTSYMLHRREFSMIRNLVLQNSAAVLQDDSGIPYRWFGADLWKVQLYGDYERPYGSFKYMEQADLRNAYKQPGTKPLPMHVGYGYKKITSNLLLAKRVVPDAEKAEPKAQ